MYVDTTSTGPAFASTIKHHFHFPPPPLLMRCGCGMGRGGTRAEPRDTHGSVPRSQDSIYLIRSNRRHPKRRCRCVGPRQSLPVAVCRPHVAPPCPGAMSVASGSGALQQTFKDLKARPITVWRAKLSATHLAHTLITSHRPTSRPACRCLTVTFTRSDFLTSLPPCQCHCETYIPDGTRRNGT